MLMERPRCHAGLARVAAVPDAPPELGQDGKELVFDENIRVAALKHNLESKNKDVGVSMRHDRDKGGKKEEAMKEMEEMGDSRG